MSIGLLGKKIGMTQLFTESGEAVPVTIIEAGPCPVVQRRTIGTDGYEAIQIGYRAERKARGVTKPLKGHFEKAKVAPQKHLREFRLKPQDSSQYAVGQILTVGLFETGEKVQVTGVTKGKGFQGGVKRWGYLGGPETHGSMFHRAPGSIGASSYPSRVFKGHHMPGRMGTDTASVKGLQVVKILPEQNLVLVKGAVPGPAGGLVAICKRG
ncbi:50S ribosomal protein L3 [Candidatus Methylomirabilis lanthanidiphila]|uniref:Large ribosomal subunit protein uL3 n=1 Tax=Candidatus Methylomirabilis lanthanidiphila TaxID=2211376 RepID=A0A564ZGC5_9BACT|nr:50S ribosomal protein L3 [Candidatus Methylomirabilis lanthanidiphila]VUZ84401.1 50S ribosomal protein L3 [Candidatus Methylomirabilis lanthanidiphila]